MNAPQETSIVIHGMTCGSCVRRVSDAIRSVPGVIDFEVSRATGIARVRHTEVLAGAESLHAALRGVGYESTSVEAT